MLGRILFTVLLGLAFSMTIGCQAKEQPQKIDLQKREHLPVRKANGEDHHIRIAVGGMITPKEGFIYYREFLDYIGDKLGKKVDFIENEKYEEINKLMKDGEIDIAFVCSGPYVDGHKEFGMELLAAPQAYGETVYYSYIIVHRNSHIQSFAELRGKSFAFADPLSNTGRLVPEYMLAKMNETPDSFFKKYIFTYAHDKSIKAVARRIADGAAVDSLIWEYANHVNPEFTSKTRIIQKSPPYSIPPVVVRKGLDPKLKNTIRRIFLEAHNDKRGAEILKSMMIDKFVVVKDSDYNSIREMKAWVANKGGK